MTEFLTYIKNGTISSSIIYNKGAVTSDNYWLIKFQGAGADIWMVIVCFILLLLLIILLKV